MRKLKQFDAVTPKKVIFYWTVLPRSTVLRSGNPFSIRLKRVFYLPLIYETLHWRWFLIMLLYEDWRIISRWFVHCFQLKLKSLCSISLFSSGRLPRKVLGDDYLSSCLIGQYGEITFDWAFFFHVTAFSWEISSNLYVVVK